MADYNEIISAYKTKPGGIIEAFHAIQKEYSYIPEEAVVAAADAFDMSKARAYGVATFYSYLKVGKRGKNVIRICESAPCHVAGADKVVAAFASEPDLNVSEAKGSKAVEPSRKSECRPRENSGSERKYSQERRGNNTAVAEKPWRTKDRNDDRQNRRSSSRDNDRRRKR